jgi:hypothetical protein
MEVRVEVEKVACGLGDHYHAGGKARDAACLRGRRHHLLHGLVRRAAERAEQVAVVHEVGADHLGEGEL